ncbi:MAG: RNA-binding cell elongation regulator Jag/EloR [Candidatus Binataceae bacterium]
MSSSTADSIEVTATSVDEAISQALERLGAQEDSVTIEVLSTPRSGVLGIGARPARVRVTRRAPEVARSGVMSPPPAPPPRPRPSNPPPPRPAAPRTVAPPPPKPPVVAARPAPPPAPPVSPAPMRPPVQRFDEDEGQAEEAAPPEDLRATVDVKAQMAEATTLLAKILELMGEQAVIENVRDDDPELLELNIKGDGSGLLIGRHGQTLDALEYMVNRVIARRFKDAAPISIDTESYRARRRGQLHRMALAKGEEAKREHIAVTLEPMPPRDRRIIHLALKDDPLITTRSEGDGFIRSIQIVPVDERRESPGPSDRGGRDRRRGRGPGPGPRDDQPPPVGQQGGFRHGQKRIV